MTRNEFNTEYAATQRNTEGYSDLQLEELNNEVFSQVSGLDVTDDITGSHVKNLFARLMNNLD